MSLSLSSPLSLYSIPLVWFVGFYPSQLKTRIMRSTIGFNNVDPRGNVARLANKEKIISPELAAKAARLDAANMNGNENFPVWAIAILAGNYAKIDHQTLNILAISYIASRVLYNTIYANQKTEFHAFIRTVVWASGISLPLYILVKAANIVRLGQ